MLRIVSFSVSPLSSHPRHATWHLRGTAALARDITFWLVAGEAAAHGVVIRCTASNDDSGDVLDLHDESNTEKEGNSVTSQMEGLTFDKDVNPNSLSLADLLSDRPHADLLAQPVATKVQAASNASAVVNWN